MMGVREVLGVIETSTSPVHVRASDGHLWYVKAARSDRPWLIRSLVPEQILGRLGYAAGFAAQVVLVEITAEDLPRFPPEVLPGVAHASHDLRCCPTAGPDRSDWPRSDARGYAHPWSWMLEGWARYCGAAILPAEHVGTVGRWFGHSSLEQVGWVATDHGEAVPGGPWWSAVSLRQARPLGGCFWFTDKPSGWEKAVGRARDALADENIRAAIAAVPGSWPVTDEEREALFWFLSQSREAMWKAPRPPSPHVYAPDPTAQARHQAREMRRRAQEQQDAAWQAVRAQR